MSREIEPLSVYLGALGMTGMTAWAGLNLVEVKASDVILISGAAGAVGTGPINRVNSWESCSSVGFIP